MRPGGMYEYFCNISSCDIWKDLKESLQTLENINGPIAGTGWGPWTERAGMDGPLAVGGSGRYNFILYLTL